METKLNPNEYKAPSSTLAMKLRLKIACSIPTPVEGNGTLSTTVDFDLLRRQRHSCYGTVFQRTHH